jgi:hypothetical protein
MLLPKICKANQLVLEQKAALVLALVDKHGDLWTRRTFKQTCPIVNASIGQHMRHSMDHIERAVNAATNLDDTTIRYDVRERGVADEHDIEAACDRIIKLDQMLENLGSSDVASHPVDASFMISGDSEQEYPLKSSVGRELFFAVHHAIHHMAMIRVILLMRPKGLEENEFPPDFGRAPSTANYDNTKIPVDNA